MLQENDVEAKLNGLKSELESDIDKLKTEINEESLTEEPVFSSESQETLDVVLKSKLGVESEIEAILESELYLLPDDVQTLLSVGKEGAVTTKDQHRRNLDYYIEKVECLKKEKERLQSMVDKASQVNRKLDEIIQNRSDTEVKAPLMWRHTMAGMVFKQLRRELHDLLDDKFPQLETEKSMSDLLQDLVEKLLKDPSDPYIEIQYEEVEPAYIEFLIKARIASRHQHDVSKIRLRDPRLS